MLTLPSEFIGVLYNHPQQGALYSELMSVAHACLAVLIQQLLHCDIIKTASIVFIHIHIHGRNRVYNPNLHILLCGNRIKPKNKSMASNELPAFK